MSRAAIHLENYAETRESTGGLEALGHRKKSQEYFEIFGLRFIYWAKKKKKRNFNSPSPIFPLFSVNSRYTDDVSAGA